MKNRKNIFLEINTVKILFIIPAIVFGLLVFSQLALANENPSENKEILFSQEPSFTINSNTSKGELQKIEKYFAANHPHLLVKFANVVVDPVGLVAFDLQLKFKGESKFHTRLRRNGGEDDWSLRIQYVDGPSLKVQQTGVRNVTLIISKDNLKTM
ncbi:MAG TPA: hypothetical protein VFM82_07965 [Flavobacteriaceae bacterium]|nr:hypothetical protein [Flavobacteriaceae bacterium]